MSELAGLYGVSGLLYGAELDGSLLCDRGCLSGVSRLILKPLTYITDTQREVTRTGHRVSLL